MGNLINFVDPPIADGTVANFASLPSAAANSGAIYIVKETTGVVFINRKRSGLYLSDGASWTRLHEDGSFVRTSATSGSDNLLLKSDGTGGNGAQESGITVDDSNNLTGVGTIDASVANTGRNFTSGEALTAGDLVYLDTDGKVWKAFATGTIEESLVIGVAQASVSADTTVLVLTYGTETALSGLSAGVVYYLSGTAGQLTSTAPSGSGDNIVRVGVAEDATTLQILPQYIYAKD
jgi:hypothetical protein